MEQSQTAPRDPKRSLIAAGVNYSLGAVLPFLLSFVVVYALRFALGENFEQSVLYRYLSFLLPQLCFAAAALLWFLRGRKRSLARRVYAPCKWYYYLYALALAFGLLFAFNSLNEFFIRFLELMGYTRQTDWKDYIPPVTDAMLSGWLLLPTMLLVAIIPAFCEETIFRGVQVYTLRESGWGTVPTVLICGAMFSLYHGNPEQTIYQFVCGACFALLAVRSGSPFPSMLAHFLNNAVVLAIGAVFGAEWTLPLAAEIPLAVVGGVLLVAALAVLIFVDKSNRQRGGMRGAGYYFLAAGAGIAVCVLEWLIMAFHGVGT